MRVPGWSDASRSQLDKLQETAKSLGADWFSYIKVSRRGVAIAAREGAGRARCGGARCLRGRPARRFGSAAGAQIRVQPGRLPNAGQASGELRLDIARKLELLKPGTWNFLWVVDFPMFEYDEKEKRFAAMHHPFTSPREEDLEKLETDPGAVKARAYDLVLNGSEIGGGSIRIHRQDIQRRVFKVLGLSDEQARERFGFFLEALEYGTPPHGGIALGHDRINALMAGEVEHPGSHCLPQDRQRHRYDVRSARRG